MSQFYFVFATRDEAYAALPQFQSDEAIAFRQKAEHYRQLEEES